MIGSGKDPRIKVLLHLDGDFVDARGHQVTTPNTYNNVWIDGKFGKAADRGTGAINMRAVGANVTQPSKFTVTAWHKRDGYTGLYIGEVCLCGIGGGWDGLSSSGIVITIVPNTKKTVFIFPKSIYEDYISIKSTATITQGVWEQYALTFDGETFRWYQNGSKIAEYTPSNIQDIFIYRGDILRFNYFRNADEIMFADDLLIEGDTYDVPQEPYK